jgi:acetyl-CoA carboxylase carboxyltransferase component
MRRGRVNPAPPTPINTIRKEEKGEDKRGEKRKRGRETERERVQQFFERER